MLDKDAMRGAVIQAMRDSYALSQPEWLKFYECRVADGMMAAYEREIARQGYEISRSRVPDGLMTEYL